MKDSYKHLMGAALLALGLGWSAAAPARPAEFTAVTPAELAERFEARPYLLVLWSIHCAPCFAELDMLAEVLRTHPELPLVLVSTDPPEAAREVEMALEDYGLSHLPTWQFGGFPERLRYAVDPDWFGELPRSYFHDAAHERTAHSGTLSRDAVLRWLGGEE